MELRKRPRCFRDQSYSTRAAARRARRTGDHSAGTLDLEEREVDPARRLNYYVVPPAFKDAYSFGLRFQGECWGFQL